LAKKRISKISQHSSRQIHAIVGPLAGGPFTEVAEALRSRIKPLLREWEKQVRRTVPPAHGVSFEDIIDHLPEILTGMADALASGEPEEIKRLMERAPEQGIHRFQLHYDVRELATEDRILRRLIVEHVEAGLGRRPDPREIES
jgi:hypothetical protein